MRCLDFSVLRFGTLRGPSSDTVKRQLPGDVQRRGTLKNLRKFYTEMITCRRRLLQACCVPDF